MRAPNLAVPGSGRWRRTPPAIFPPIMGLFGLGLCWRRAAEAGMLPGAVGEMTLGAVTLLFLFAAFAYLAKLARRTAALVDDLRILPGRAGLAAMVLCVYLLSIALLPYWPVLARAVLFAGLVAHLGFVAVLVHVFVTGPAEQRRVSPVWHLSFVGFIIGGLAAALMGMEFLALFILAATAIMATTVWAISLDQIVREGVPAPLRPLLAIHLSPAALLGMVAARLGLLSLAQIFAVLAALLLAVMVLRLRWLTQAGFSPMWGAFTFPLAATGSLWLGLGGVWLWPGMAVLAVTTAVIPAIAWGVLRMWASGQLAVRTNAATA